MDSWKTSREKLFSLACREKETYSLFNMSHCLKVTSDFHQICWRVFLSTENLWKDVLCTSEWHIETSCTFFHRLYFLFSSNWMRSIPETRLKDLFCIRFCTEVWRVICLNESQKRHWWRITQWGVKVTLTNNRTNFSASAGSPFTPADAANNKQ